MNFIPFGKKLALMAFQSEKRKAEFEKGGGLHAAGYRKSLSTISHILSPVRWLAAWAVVVAIFGLVAPGSGQAEIQIRTQITTNAVIPDLGQVVSSVTINNAGIGAITGVTASVRLDSPSATNPMWLGDMFASLTHGTALEAGNRTATLFNTDPNNSASSLDASYTPDGLTGAWLPSNQWSLLVADLEAGGQGRLTGWDLAIRGTPASSGTIDPGAGGEISMTGSSLGIGARANSTGTGAAAVALKADSGQTMVFSNGISGQGFQKTGVGLVEIQGDSSDFNGQLQVAAGKLVVSGTLGTNSTTVVGSGGTLGGTGTVGALQVASGGTLAVGNSPGQLNAGSTTWGPGGAFEWEINSFPGTAGANWDFLNIAGSLTIDATSSPGSKFLIDVVSLLGSSGPGFNTPGDAVNFNAYDNYSFAIVTASGGITGFNVAKFTLSTANFTNDFYDGVWSLSTGTVSGGGTSLLLNYSAATAIPEPNSASLVLLGLGIAYLRRRRNSVRGA